MVFYDVKNEIMMFVIVYDDKQNLKLKPCYDYDVYNDYYKMKIVNWRKPTSIEWNKWFNEARLFFSKQDLWHFGNANGWHRSSSTGICTKRLMSNHCDIPSGNLT